MILKATKAKSYCVFLPSLAYQEARRYSKKCWNAKEALLTNLYISQLLLFCITKTQSWLRLVDPVNTVFKAFQAWQISISQQLCFIGTFFSSNCQGCFCIVSQHALKIRIIYMSHMCSPPQLLWESDIDSVINKVSGVTDTTFVLQYMYYTTVTFLFLII